MIRIVLLVIGFTVLSSNCYATGDTLKQQRRIDKIVRKIEKQKSLLLNYQLTAKNRRLANELSKVSSSAELIRLTTHQNPAVFCIAYLILAKRNEPFAESIYQRYLKFNEQEFIEWDKEVNRINRKHKSDVVMLYGKSNFIDDVRNRRKFIDRIK
jgi:hypothetical protein